MYAAPVFGITAMVEISAFRECRFMSATHVIGYPACPLFHTGVSGESNYVHPVHQIAHIPMPNVQLTNASLGVPAESNATSDTSDSIEG